MKGLDNQLYVTLLIFSNIVAILQVIANEVLIDDPVEAQEAKEGKETKEPSKK